MRVNSEIVFGATVAVTKEMNELSDGKAFQYKKERMAQELGMKIAEEKGWLDYDEGDIVTSDLRVYVFTPAELRDYMDSKFKAKLRHMAATEEYLSNEQRQALMIQSERF